VVELNTAEGVAEWGGASTATWMTQLGGSDGDMDMIAGGEVDDLDGRAAHVN
jgi:hypothetical protein